MNSERVSVEGYAMHFDASNVAIVADARTLTDDAWESLTVQRVRFGTMLHANEATLKAASIERVVSGHVEFRANYVARLLRTSSGELHIVDGHHRVAMYHALRRDLPARIMSSDLATRLHLASVKRAHAEAVEPVISKTVVDVVADRAEFAIFDKRLKTVDSLADKIARDAQEKGVTYDEAAQQIRDVVRYTAVIDDSNYWATGSAILDDLASAGFSVVKNPQGWNREGYRGRNAMLALDTGDVFELQFHTPTSLQAKRANHQLYKRERSSSCDEIRARLREQQRANFDAVPVPADVLLI